MLFQGHGVILGVETGKVVSYGTRCKQCRICQAADRLGEKAREHNCAINYSGSAKSMEADIAVEAIKTIEQIV